MLKNNLLVAFLFLAQWSFAQTGSVSGKIMDGEFNEVLPFANVLVKGTSIGTTSDFEGAYSIDLAPGTYTLVFSFLGYTSQEIKELGPNLLKTVFHPEDLPKIQEHFKKLVLDMQNINHFAPNAGHTAQNDGK